MPSYTVTLCISHLTKGNEWSLGPVLKENAKVESFYIKMKMKDQFRNLHQTIGTKIVTYPKISQLKSSLAMSSTTK